MKSALILLLANAASVAGEGVCSRMKFTFNLKPVYIPNGDTQSCFANDPDSDLIEAAIRSGAITKMTEMGYTNVSPSLVKKNDQCPPHECNVYPGDACLPYCVDITFCIGDELAATGATTLSTDHVSTMQAEQIDLFRDDLPSCLGVPDKFMLDLHYETV